MNNMEQLEADFDTELTAGNLRNGMKDAGASAGDLWKVPVENLRIIEKFNVRVHNDKYEVQIEALKNSRMSEGFYQHEPLAGYVAKDDAGKDLVYIFGGHTRLLARQRANDDGAGIKVVPVVVGNKKGMSIAIKRLLTHSRRKARRRWKRSKPPWCVLPRCARWSLTASCQLRWRPRRVMSAPLKPTEKPVLRAISDTSMPRPTWRLQTTACS